MAARIPEGPHPHPPLGPAELWAALPTHQAAASSWCWPRAAWPSPLYPACANLWELILQFGIWAAGTLGVGASRGGS